LRVKNKEQKSENRKKVEADNTILGNKFFKKLSGFFRALSASPLPTAVFQDSVCCR